VRISALVATRRSVLVQAGVGCSGGGSGVDGCGGSGGVDGDDGSGGDRAV